jgi:hypothetical protein
LATLLPDIPHPARVVVETLLEKDLAKRYANARELLDDLDRFRTGQTLERDAAARKVHEIEEAVNASTASLETQSRPGKPATSARDSNVWKIAAAILALVVASYGAFHWIESAKHVGPGIGQAPAADPGPPNEPAPPNEPMPPKKRLGEVQRERPALPIDAFDRYDANKDGRITPDELPPALRDRLMRADTNGDGAISRQEFDAFRQRVQRRLGPQQ